MASAAVGDRSPPSRSFRQPSVTFSSTYEQQLAARRWLGWPLVATGGGVVLMSRRLARRQRLEVLARQRHSEARAAVAEAHGWEFHEQDQSVTHAWQEEGLLAAPPLARDVVSGTSGALAFWLFDVEDPANERVDVRQQLTRFTVCAVRLDFDPPKLQLIVAPEHRAWLRVVSTHPAEEADLSKVDDHLSWAALVLTRDVDRERARHLLTPVVLAHVRTHHLSFVLLGSWLSVTVPLVVDAEAIPGLADAAVTLAALFPAGPPPPPQAPLEGRGLHVGGIVKRIWDWLRSDP